MKNKIVFQKKLFELFDEKDYNMKEISEILQIELKEVKKICKTAIRNNAGRYERLNIIIACMGGMLYAD